MVSFPKVSDNSLTVVFSFPPRKSVDSQLKTIVSAGLYRLLLIEIVLEVLYLLIFPLRVFNFYRLSTLYF